MFRQISRLLVKSDISLWELNETRSVLLLKSVPQQIGSNTESNTPSNFSMFPSNAMFPKGNTLNSSIQNAKSKTSKNEILAECNFKYMIFFHYWRYQTFYKPVLSYLDSRSLFFWPKWKVFCILKIIRQDFKSNYPISKLFSQNAC